MRKSSILLFLVWLSGCSSKSFMERTTCSSCALCALCCQASLFTAQPHPHCFLRHKGGACAGSTSSSAVSLTTNDMESRAAQAFATTIDWRSDGVSNRRSTRKLGTGDFLQILGHAQEFVLRRVAPSDRPLRAGGRGDH